MNVSQYNLELKIESTINNHQNIKSNKAIDTNIWWRSRNSLNSKRKTTLGYPTQTSIHYRRIKVTRSSHLQNF